MLVLWIFLCQHALAFLDIGIPRIKLEEENFEVEKKSTGVWSMYALFGRTASGQISSYQIEGWSPCIVQNPYLDLKTMYTYKESVEILDFSIVDNKIYYLTEHGIKILRTDELIKEADQKVTMIEGVDTKRFIYLHVLKMKDDKLLLFLKSWDDTLSYVTLEDDKTTTKVFTTDPLFANFTDTMQMQYEEDFVIIPAGKNGLLVYKYDTESKELKYKSKLFETGDVRDFVLTYSTARNSFVALIADYEQGLLILDVDDKSLKESNIRVTEVDRKEELVKIKSLLLFDDNNEDKLLAILDVLGGASKYTILSLELDKNISVSYAEMRLIDGVANFGDYYKGYVSVILPNSIMISKVINEGNSMVSYLNRRGLNNAKITKMPNHVGPCLLYSYKSQLVVTQIEGKEGFLICQTGEQTGTTMFSILGQAKNCRMDMRQIGNCYYEKVISLQVVDKQSMNSLVIMLTILGIVMGVILVGVIIVLVIMCKKFGATYRTLDSEMQRLTIGSEERKQ